MHKLLHPHLLLLAVICCFTNTSCSKDDSKGGNTNATGVRLKHFTTATAVHAAIGSFMTQYKNNDGEFENYGNYPNLPHIYRYTVYWTHPFGDDYEASRHISADAGMGSDSREEILEYSPGYAEIKDSRLGKPPYENVFVIKKMDSDKRDWRFEMYINLDAVNNDNQVITLSGTYSPWHDDVEPMAPKPPGDAAAISAMLQLTETIP
ncbi:hypothetical protein MKQ68_12745 [Chitinophaga horti]|uniref:DUF4136 domain-containing protein n=1 Tax=Chitinophaga horti TaxID=2920382 RepID=A0ABY6IYH1_9BACT|nr:hypothetical protein [Chitinophaga horti]UYQ90962.1 hypothetical protein MKQ68_12745 [Chitinophaga horti]